MTEQKSHKMESQMISAQKSPLQTSTGSLANIFFVNSGKKSLQTSPNRFQSSQHKENIKSLYESRNNKPSLDMENLSRENQNLKQDIQRLQSKLTTNKQKYKVIKEEYKTFQVEYLKLTERTHYQTDTISFEIQSYQNQLKELQTQSEELVLEKNQELLKLKQKLVEVEDNHQLSQARETDLERQLNLKTQNNVQLTDQIESLQERLRVKHQKIIIIKVQTTNMVLQDQVYKDYDSKLEEFKAIITRNEENLERFYSLTSLKEKELRLKEYELLYREEKLNSQGKNQETQTQIELTYGSVLQTQQDDSLLCEQLNEKLWEKRVNIEINNLNVMKAQLQEREIQVLQKEKQVSQFLSHMKGRFQINK